MVSLRVRIRGRVNAVTCKSRLAPSFLLILLLRGSASNIGSETLWLFSMACQYHMRHSVKRYAWFMQCSPKNDD